MKKKSTNMDPDNFKYEEIDKIIDSVKHDLSITGACDTPFSITLHDEVVNTLDEFALKIKEELMNRVSKRMMDDIGVHPIEFNCEVDINPNELSELSDKE